MGSALAWYSDPDFIAARNRTIPPGERTSYVEPCPTGSSPSDVTDFIYGQATWSSRHMPNILYRLRPGASVDWNNFKRSKPPRQKLDAQGQSMWEQWPANPQDPKPLLDFEILPDRIGTNERWWKFEAWRRLDPRIKWNDIVMRMSSLNRPSEILLRSRVSRPRIEYYLLSWFQSSRGAQVNDVILGNLSPAQIQNNTARGSTPGLIDPALGRAGGRVYLSGETSDDDTESENDSGLEGVEGSAPGLAITTEHARTARSPSIHSTPAVSASGSISPDAICADCRVYLGIGSPQDNAEPSSSSSVHSSEHCIHCQASQKLKPNGQIHEQHKEIAPTSFASSLSLSSVDQEIRTRHVTIDNHTFPSENRANKTSNTLQADTEPDTEIIAVTFNGVNDSSTELSPASTRSSGGKRKSSVVGENNHGKALKRSRIVSSDSTGSAL